MSRAHPPSRREAVRSRLRRLVVTGLAVALAGSSAQATVYAPIEWGALVASSAAIVHGQVVDVHVQRVGDGRAVESLVTVRVLAAFKGETGPTVTLRIPGGQLGRYLTVVPGAPRFARGEEVVLVLGRDRGGVRTLLGLAHGVLRVIRDAATAVRRVQPAPQAGAGSEWRLVVRGDPTRSPAVTLDELAQAIRNLVAGAEP